MLLQPFTELVGPWEGSTGFRLMPGDSPYAADATADVSTAATGNMVAIAYTCHIWRTARRTASW